MAALVFWPPGRPEPLDVEATFPASLVAPRSPLPRRDPVDEERESRLIVASIDAVWRPVFRRVGERYERAEVGFFSTDDEICGDRPNEDDIAGLYCPSERRIWLSRRAMEKLDALDWAYVVAHEVGHHVQELRGTVDADDAPRVAHELQADCYAGVWAGAAGAPEPSLSLYTVDDGTHGTPGQQQDWLRRGRRTRRPGACASP